MERIRVKLSPAKPKGRKILSQKSPLGRPIPVITGMGGVLRDIESKNSQKIDELSQGVLNQGQALNNEIIKQGVIASNAIEGVRQENSAVYNELGKHILANNPHGITKETIGLNRVENTSDIEKPVSIPVQMALNKKADKEELIAIEEKIEESIKGQEKIKNDVSAMGWIGGVGGGGASVHNELTGRDDKNCHPIKAIKGLQDELDGKQATISDLDDIRAGASAGSTAVQPSELNNYVTTNTTQTITAQKTFLRTEASFQDSVARFVSTYNSSSQGWRGRVIIGAKDYTFLIGTYNGMAAIGGHKFSDSSTESNADWSDIYFQPDGTKAVYLGGNAWTPQSGWFKVQNSSNNGGKAQVNIGSISSTNWKDVAYKGENISDFNNDAGYTSNVGTVTSVNNVSPVDGNVSLTLPDPLPSQSGNSGKYLTTNGTSASWGVPKTHNLFDFMWRDAELNDQSWLRADTFSWQDGTVYTDAYNHLVSDISGKTATSETVGSYTISYYLADDGHKITTDETNAANIYNESGASWYYVLDTANQRFKLPRTKYGFTGLRDAVGKYVEAGLPNITGQFNWANAQSGQGCFKVGTYSGGYGNGTAHSDWHGTALDASLSNSIYGNSTTVQPPATQMYLYFYVGQFSQSATEQTAGLNSSLFNGKADVDLSNAASNASAIAKETIVGWGMPDNESAVSVTTTVSETYTCPSDGYLYLAVYTNNSANGFLGYQSSLATYRANVYICSCVKDTSAVQTSIYPVQKGEVLTCSLSSAYNKQATFIPVKGE